MIRQLRQKHLDVTDPEQGDCFKTCVAMILDIDPELVPNFCAYGKEKWWRIFQDWLEQIHLTAIEVNISKQPLCWTVGGTPCIVSGKSPRGDWLHSVVAASMEERDYEYLFDPHPDDTWLDDVQYITFFASLRPDLTRRSDEHIPPAPGFTRPRACQPEPCRANDEGTGG
jgi:hypothetical protein